MKLQKNILRHDFNQNHDSIAVMLNEWLPADFWKVNRDIMPSLNGQLKIADLWISKNQNK